MIAAPRRTKRRVPAGPGARSAVSQPRAARAYGGTRFSCRGQAEGYSVREEESGKAWTSIVRDAGAASAVRFRPCSGELICLSRRSRSPVWPTVWTVMSTAGGAADGSSDRAGDWAARSRNSLRFRCSPRSAQAKNRAPHSAHEKGNRPKTLKSLSIGCRWARRVSPLPQHGQSRRIPLYSAVLSIS